MLGDGHKTINIINKEIDALIEAINPSAICIVGGEPLEHPYLNKVIKYIHDKGVTPALFSNVLKLDHKTLDILVHQGLKVVYAHIDSQTRNKKELDINRDRDNFAKLLRKFNNRVYGIQSAIISRDNIEYAGDILKWCHNNRDVIKYCVFTLDGHKTGNDGLEIVDIIPKIKEKIKNFRLNTYLEGIQTPNLRWAQSVMINKRYASASIIKVLNSLYRRFTGRYVSILTPRIFKYIDIFSVVIVKPHKKGTLDFCEACPDQTVVWMKKNGVEAPLIIHSCVSPDFLINGSSDEEQRLSIYLENNKDKIIKASNYYKGNKYSSDAIFINKFKK
jgi:hypothetical protein